MPSNETGPAGLREIHKDCLRLAARHYSSKEIARMLGISKHTVDQRLRYATQQMGAFTRFEAARLFSELEAQHGTSELCDRILYNPPHVSDKEPHVIYPAPGNERDLPPGSGQSRLQDAQTPFTYGEMSKIDSLFTNPISSRETRPLSLSLPIKTLVIAAVAVASMLAFGAAVAALEVLSRI